MLFDIIIVAIVTIAIMLGYKRGFAVSLFNTASSVLSLILIYILKNPLTAYIKQSGMGISLYEGINKAFYENYVTSTNELKDIDKLPGFLKDSLTSGLDTTADVINYLSDRTFDILVFIISFIIVWLLVKLIIRISPKIIKVFTKLPVIKQIDKLLGICFGFISGCIWTLLFVNIMSVISMYFNCEFVGLQISSSFVVEFISSMKLNLFIN